MGPAIKPSRNDRNLDFPIKYRILYCTKDNIRLRMRCFADDISSLIYLVESQVNSTGNIEQDSASTININIK